MARRLFIIAAIAAAALVPQLSSAQTKIEPEPDDAIEHDIRTGLSATAVWRVSDKVSIDGGYVMMTTDNVSRIFRHQFNVGAAYTPWKPLKVGGGYSYIAQYNSNGTMHPKHRVFCYAEGSLYAGGWKFVLYEKFQMTHNAYDINVYKNPKNSLDLKSRFKVSYTSFKHLEPYILAELWNSFNDASYITDSDGVKRFYAYDDAYITRIKGAIGLKWKISGNHSLDFSYNLDYCRHKKADVDRETGILDSYKWNKKIAHNFSLGYVFVF